MKEKENKLDIEKLKEVMESMVDGFDKEHLKHPMYKHFIDNAKWLDNPDNVYTMIEHPFKRCLALAIQTTQGLNDEVVNLWLSYEFLENNISQLCNQLYGMGCSVDKGNFIVKSFIKYKKTGIMPKLDWKQKYTFHYPESCSLKQWFALVEGVDRLKYGYNKEYLLAVADIMKTHNKYLKEKNENV